ncbi:MAG: DUF362 domain-containing protein [Lachnospiraceae bacterium]|nr:DUF362 domain-containing protein [Lachnospiraceae bacterium]
MKKNEIIKRYGIDYTKITEDLLEYSDLKNLIPDKNTCIGIKPNLVCPTPADYGATTHTEVVEGIIKYLLGYDFKNIIITEGSWIGDKTSEAYEYCGYRTLCEKYNLEFVDTQKDTTHTENLAGLDLKICDVVKRIDFMINVPVLKGHCQTNITCALKNMKGLIPNSEKRHFHTMGLHKPIGHLSLGIKQDFIVVDHICGDLDFEEGGNPVKTDCIMVARDAVLLDSYVCKLLGYTLDDVPYIKYASKLGCGSTDLDNLLVNVLNEENAIIKSFKGSEEDPYEKALKAGEKLLEVSYAVNDYDSCSACYGNLVPALYRLKEEGKLNMLLNKLNEKGNGKIAIGQGHRGSTGHFGIGNCCRAFEHHVSGCPPKEEEIYNKLLKYIEN